MRLLLAAGLLAAVALAGCRSESQIKQAMRDEVVGTCRSRLQQQGGTPGLDSGRLCDCVGRNVVDQRSMADLDKMRDDKAATVQAVGSAFQACAREQMPADAPVPPPSETNRAAEEVADEVE